MFSALLYAQTPILILVLAAHQGRPQLRNTHDDRRKARPLLRLSAVLDRTGLSRATLYRKIQCGAFPRQVRIAVRCAGWRESAVNDWMKNPMFYSVDEADRRLYSDGPTRP
jgi:prophage regulatory protein